MSQKSNLTINNPHCLRSKKLNEEQNLLSRYIEEKPISNSATFRFLKETINHIKQSNKINNSIKKNKNNPEFIYSPLLALKRSKSSRSKPLLSNKIKNSNTNKKNKDSFNNKNRNQNEKSNSKRNFRYNNNNKKNWDLYDYNIAKHKKMKDMKRNGIRGKQKYVYIKNDEKNNQDKNNFILCINKTEEIQKLLLKYNKHSEYYSSNDKNNYSQENSIKDNIENNKSTDISNNNNDSNDIDNENDNGNIAPMDEAGIYSEDIFNNMTLNNSNNMVVDYEIDGKNNSITLRKNSVIKKVMKKMKNRNKNIKEKMKKKKIICDSDEEMNNDINKKQENNKNKKEIFTKKKFEEDLKLNGNIKVKEKEKINKNIINNKGTIKRDVKLRIPSSFVNNFIVNKDNNKEKNKTINDLTSEKKEIKSIKKDISSKPIFEEQANTKKLIFGVYYPPKIEEINYSKDIKNNLEKNNKSQNKDITFDNNVNNNNLKEKINDNNLKEINKRILDDNNINKINNNSLVTIVPDNNNNLPDISLDFRFKSKKERTGKKFQFIIENISHKKYLGHKSQRTESEAQIKLPKKRGRKKKKISENKLESFDIEVSGEMSDFNQNLKRSEKSSIPKIPETKPLYKYTEEISSQNTSREQNKHSFSSANLINDNNLNNVNKKYKKYYIKKKKHENNLFIRIGEEEDDENNYESYNNQKKNNENEENLEILSLSSTPEAKKKLRNNINQYNVYSNERQNKRHYKKRKYNKYSKSNYVTYNNERNYQSDSSNDMPIQRRDEDFIKVKPAQNKHIKNHKNNNESISEDESESENNESNLKIEKDPNYFLTNTDYIKYDPIKNYCTLKNNKNLNMNLNKIEKLLPILEIPRIRPKNPMDAIKIKEKLQNYNISINKVDENEKYYYRGSFPMISEKNGIEVYVPCFADKLIFKNQKIFPKLKKFDEDNDTFTDSEQLELEIKRGNDCLLQFLKKVEEGKDYIKEKISRNNITKHDMSDDEEIEIEDESGNENDSENAEYEGEEESEDIIMGEKKI